MLNDPTTPEPSKIILYGHEACPMMPPVWAMLKQSRVPVQYINIHQDQFGRERVRQINQGYESVPTLVFLDGSTLTEPSGVELRRKLIEQGYSVPFIALIFAHVYQIIIVVGVLVALLTAFDVF